MSELLRKSSIDVSGLERGRAVILEIVIILPCQLYLISQCHLGSFIHEKMRVVGLVSIHRILLLVIGRANRSFLTASVVKNIEFEVLHAVPVESSKVCLLKLDLPVWLLFEPICRCLMGCRFILSS